MHWAFIHRILVFHLPWFFLISIFCHVKPVIASNPDSIRLETILKLVNQAQENGNYRVSITLCQDLLKESARNERTFGTKFTDLAELYLTEAYRELSLDSLLENQLSGIRKSLDQKSGEAITFQTAVRQFAYYIYYADFLEDKKRANQAVSQLNAAIKFLLDHPEFYGEDYIRGNSESLAHRLFQCYRRLGKIAMDAHDYIEAGNHFYEALKQARKADQVFSSSGPPTQESEEIALEKLLDLARRSGDQPMYNTYIKQYQNIQKSSAYSLTREKDNLYAQLQSDALDWEQGLQLVSRMDLNALASEDLAVQYAKLDLFIKFSRRDSCIPILTRLEKQVRHPVDIAAYFRAKAGFAVTSGDFLAMSDAMDSALHHLSIHKSTDSIWGDLGLRTQLLETVMKGIQYHEQGYVECRDAFFLEKKTGLLKHFITGLRSIRNDLISDEDRLSFVQRLMPILDLALETYTDSLHAYGPDYESILSCFEAGKSFNLHSEYDLRKRFSPQDLVKFTRLSSELKVVKKQLQNPDHDYDSLMGRHNNLQMQLRDLKRLHARLPENKWSSITHLQSTLDRESTLLEYFRGKSHIYALLVNADKIHVYRLPVQQDTIGQLINDLRLSISMANEPRLTRLRDSLYRQSALKLFRGLLLPMGPFLKHRIILMPDLELARVPFAVLLTEEVTGNDYKNWPYLIRNHVISTQYSLELWLDQVRNTANKKEGVKPKSFISFAPVFNDLFHNQEESREISALVGKASGFFGQEANRANFIQFAGDGRILHIASHAHSNEDNQGESYIRLQEDTLLAGEVGLMHLPQDLVFLSACETGTGKFVSGEGVMSLARSFFQAGSRSVISTLWPIRDDLSKDQVIKVYRNLRAGQPKDEAIRNMQINYINKAGFGQAFPAFWAAYQSQGDQVPLFVNHMISLGYILGLAPILALCLAFLFYRKYFGVSQ